MVAVDLIVVDVAQVDHRVLRLLPIHEHAEKQLLLRHHLLPKIINQ